MIAAKFYCRDSDGSIHMELRGHACSAPKGQDLVCAGVSALACTLGSAAERMYEQGMLRRCPKVELADGSAEVIAVPKVRFFQAALMVFWTVQNGIGTMAESFPGNVRVEEALKSAE